MVYERGDLVLRDELRIQPLNFLNIARFEKFFFKLWQKHFDLDITPFFTFNFKVNFFVFRLLCRMPYWQGYGFVSPWGRFLVEMRVKGQRLAKYCQCVPVHNQRTHSNSRTQQIQDPVFFKKVISSLGVKRRSMKTRANYAKKKLTPLKKKTTKTSTKKKGPVIRSRDKAKSVWA